MNKEYVIITDSNSEIPYTFAEAHQLPYVPMPYALDGVETAYDLGKTGNSSVFFDKMREGATPVTAALNPAFYVDMWTPYLQQGLDILFIAFSSKLSAAFSHLCAAREMLLEQYPQATMRLVDTLAISMAEGQLVYHAVLLKEEGASLDEVAEWVETHKQQAIAWFTVEDLVYLKRGGRLSATSAFMGTLLNVKPLLHIDEEGRLVPVEKVMGWRRALRELANKVLTQAIEPEKHILHILHGDNLSDALLLKEMISEKMKFKDIWVSFIGPVIGTHAGPGAMALCFFAKNRNA